MPVENVYSLAEFNGIVRNSGNKLVVVVSEVLRGDDASSTHDAN